jgi:hypothetical protein
LPFPSWSIAEVTNPVARSILDANRSATGELDSRIPKLSQLACRHTRYHDAEVVCALRGGRHLEDMPLEIDDAEHCIARTGAVAGQ